MVNLINIYEVIDILLEPFTYNYMNTAIWISALIGCVGGLLSAYIILKGWSSIGNGISHAILPGIVVCYQLMVPFSIGASIAGMLATGMMVMIKEKTKLKEDVSIAVVYISFYSFAMFILSLSPTSIDIFNIFLGNVLSINKSDILQVLIISLCVLLVISMKWRDFLHMFFDEEHARSTKINIQFLKMLFFTSLITAIAIGFQTVGILLVIATVIIPGATSSLIVKSFGKYLILSSLIGAASGFIGTYISYFVDCSPGGIVVITQILLFLLSIILYPKRGKAF